MRLYLIIAALPLTEGGERKDLLEAINKGFSLKSSGRKAKSPDQIAEQLHLGIPLPSPNPLKINRQAINELVIEGIKIREEQVEKYSSRENVEENSDELIKEWKKHRGIKP